MISKKLAELFAESTTEARGAALGVVVARALVLSGKAAEAV